MSAFVSVRRGLLGSALAVGMATASASAADLPVRAAPAPAPVYAPVATYNWSGFYVGGHVGYGWADFDFRDPYVKITAPGLGGLLPGGGLFVGLPLAREFDGDGVLGGAQVGVNAQIGALVVGMEGDFSWTDLDGEFRSTFGPAAIAGIGVLRTSEGVSAELDWLATVRGRVGWAVDRFLVYGTAGVAFGQIEGAGDITITSGANRLTVAASEQNTHVGWTAGFGVEGMITPNLSAKLEYLYANLGWENYEGPAVISSPAGTLVGGVPGGLSVALGGDFKAEVHTVKAGLNYRFNLFGM